MVPAAQHQGMQQSLQASLEGIAQVPVISDRQRLMRLMDPHESRPAAYASPAYASERLLVPTMNAQSCKFNYGISFLTRLNASLAGRCRPCPGLS